MRRRRGTRARKRMNEKCEKSNEDGRGVRGKEMSGERENAERSCAKNGINTKHNQRIKRNTRETTRTTANPSLFFASQNALQD